MEEGSENLAFSPDAPNGNTKGDRPKLNTLLSSMSTAPLTSRFQEDQYGTIDVWWLFDDGGKNGLGTVLVLSVYEFMCIDKFITFRMQLIRIFKETNHFRQKPKQHNSYCMHKMGVMFKMLEYAKDSFECIFFIYLINKIIYVCYDHCLKSD